MFKNIYKKKHNLTLFRNPNSFFQDSLFHMMNKLNTSFFGFFEQIKTDSKFREIILGFVDSRFNW